MNPVGVGIVGLGGFGAAVLNSVRKLEAQGLVKLTAVCEPNTTLHGQLIGQLKQQGIKAFTDIKEISQSDAQVLWMPVPVPLHRPFTEAALAAGKWVLCEKPAAGSIQDVDAMIAARDRYNGKAAIAFQDIHEPSTVAIKQRLLNGEIGRIREATVVCCWARPASYFARNNWAGKVKIGDTWVLDGPAMNAMAHFVNLPLFLLGEKLREMPQIQKVDAELYRGRAMESSDTCCIRAHLASGTRATIYMTHSCPENFGPEIRIKGDRGELLITQHTATFTVDGKSETIKRQVDHIYSLKIAVELWTGANPNGVLCSLEMARPHVLLLNAAYDATPIKTIPSEFVTVEGEDPLPRIRGIQQLMRDAECKGQMLSETGTPWASRGGSLETAGYKAFAGRYL